MSNYKTKSAQLCWECDRATGGCPWSSKGQAIKGWIAKKTLVLGDGGRKVPSYDITACPLFKPENTTDRKLLVNNATAVARLLGICHATLCRKTDEQIFELARKKGVVIYIEQRGKRRFYEIVRNGING